MVGNQIGLFPVMMVGMMLYRPIQAMLSYKDGEMFSLIVVIIADVIGMATLVLYSV